MMLERGQRVTVRVTTDRWRFWRNADSWSGRVYAARARVVRSQARDALVRIDVGEGYAIQHVFRREEGTTWVRGWDSEEARAFEVVEGLR